MKILSRNYKYKLFDSLLQFQLKDCPIFSATQEAVMAAKVGIEKYFSRCTDKELQPNKELPASKKIKLSSASDKHDLDEDGDILPSVALALAVDVITDLEFNDSSTQLTPEQTAIVNDKATGGKLIKASKLFDILDPDMGRTWFRALEGEFRKDYFARLDKFVTAERSKAKVYPEPDHVWEWTKHCPIQDIKVVILGQDPYHQPNQAHGLCFSVKKGVRLPPSLVNIFKELKSDIADFNIPTHGDLQGWTSEGVLLLNAVLTVEASKANSHKDKGWEKITNAVISWISTNLDSVVFMLWGAHAQKMAANVDKRKHHLLTSVHPSPLSAHRGFLGCKHFSKANDLLIQAGKKPVNWNNLK